MGEFRISLRTKRDDEIDRFRRAIDSAQRERDALVVLKRQVIYLIVAAVIVAVICIKEGVW